MNEFHDIIIVNIPDTYENMVHKVVALFKWGARSCGGASYVFRCNDDVYLRLKPVFGALREQVPARIYAGYFLEGVTVLRPEDEVSFCADTS